MGLPPIGQYFPNTHPGKFLQTVNEGKSIPPPKGGNLASRIKKTQELKIPL